MEGEKGKRDLKAWLDDGGQTRSRREAFHRPNETRGQAKGSAHLSSPRGT